jgi:hypothetical protein
MFYVKVEGGVVVDRAVFGEPMPQDWPDYASWHQNDEAQIGWLYDGTTFHPPPPPPPEMNEVLLYDAISDVCPIYSVTVGDGTDRSTWTYDPKPEATAQQKADADNVIATIPIAPPETIKVVDFIGRFTNAEYRAFTAAAWRQSAGNAKNADVVLFDDPIKLEKKKVATLKTSLVTDGILTQARADEIFA